MIQERQLSFDYFFRVALLKRSEHEGGIMDAARCANPERITLRLNALYLYYTGLYNVIDLWKHSTGSVHLNI
jgi:hypothetical protein